MRSATLIGMLALHGWANGQYLTNPGFESNCAFSMTGWSWFCSVPDFYPGEPHSGCYSVMLPTSDDLDPCFSNGEAIGVHTRMYDVEAGVPYELSLFDMMSYPMLTSNVGIFVMPAGQTPVYFGDGVMLDGWMVGGSIPEIWVQEVYNFTIPIAYAGRDVYFYIEYSVAPDPQPGGKYFDDIAITSLATTVDETRLGSSELYPNPATDRIWIDLPEQPISVVLIDALGRELSLPLTTYLDNRLEVSVAHVPDGPCSLAVTMKSGVHSFRFIKG